MRYLKKNKGLEMNFPELDLLPRVGSSATPLPSDCSPLDYLLGVMRGQYEYNTYRFRAAVAALPFTAPKLAASYNVNSNAKDFAELLAERRQRCLQRQAAPVIEPVNYNAPFPKLHRRF
jgi:hypothetical protein